MTLPKPVDAADWMERSVTNRGADSPDGPWLDPRTFPKPCRARRPPCVPAGSEFARGRPLLDKKTPSPTSTRWRTRTVTSASACAARRSRPASRRSPLRREPFIDLAQRQVNVRGEPVIHESADEADYALLEGRTQLCIANVFDYLMIRSWFQDQPDNGTILLGWAQPARPRSPTPTATRPADRRSDRAARRFQRLVRVLRRSERQAPRPRRQRHPRPRHIPHAGHRGQPLVATPFFGSVTLRRYPKTPWCSTC